MPYKDRKRQIQFRINQKRKQKLRMIAYKGGCCSICGYNKCPAALEFHHLNPKEKDKGLGKMKGLNWQKVVRELDKCILVCSNCHKEIEYQK